MFELGPAVSGQPASPLLASNPFSHRSAASDGSELQLMRHMIKSLEDKVERQRLQNKSDGHALAKQIDGLQSFHQQWVEDHRYLNDISESLFATKIMRMEERLSKLGKDDASESAFTSRIRAIEDQLVKVEKGDAMEERLMKVEKDNKCLAVVVDKHKKDLAILSDLVARLSQSREHSNVGRVSVSLDDPPMLDQDYRLRDAIAELADRLNDALTEQEEMREWRAEVDSRIDCEQLISPRSSPDKSDRPESAGQSNDDDKHQMLGKAHQDDLILAPVSDLERAEPGNGCSTKEHQEAFHTLTREALESHSPGYCIQESTWDSCLFIGFDCVGVTGTILIFCGTLLSMASEMLFTLVVYANYSQHPFTDDMLNGLLHWRSAIAHHVNYADADSKTSLASRVCARATSTATSMYQLNTFSDLSAFRRSPIDELHDINGYFLCNMALILWYFAILEDVTMNYKFTVSILSLPRGVSHLQVCGDQFKIVSLRRRHQFGIVLLASLPRMIIALFLGYVGTFFLAYTSNVGELLLNAVALVFVLEIDEMLFQALVPHNVKVLATTVEPLHYVRGGSWNFVFRAGATTTAIIIVNIAIMMPFAERLDLAMRYLCAGNKDILYMENKVNGLVMFAQSPTYDPKETAQMSYRKMAVLELAGLGVTDSLRHSDYKNDSSVQLSLDGLWAAHFGDRNYAADTFLCVNHLDEEQVKAVYSPSRARQYLTASRLFFDDSLGMPLVENCSHLNFTEVCMSVAHVSARGICARYCGCDNPWSGQFFAKGRYGCPSSCGIRWSLNSYYLTPPSIASFTDHCMDVPTHVLLNEPFWRNYVQGFKSYSILFVQKEKEVVDITQFLLNRGCEAVATIAGFMDLCSPSPNFRSMRLWCPSTCQCTASDMQECPHSCSYTKNYQLLSGGESCSIETSIRSPEECQFAFGTIKGALLGEDADGNFTMMGDIPFITAGCALFRGMLIWSTWNGTEMDPGVWPLCRQAGIRLPMDKLTGGNFAFGQQMARCHINPENC